MGNTSLVLTLYHRGGGESGIWATGGTEDSLVLIEGGVEALKEVLEN